MLEVGKAGIAGGARVGIGCRFFLGLVGTFVVDDESFDLDAPRGGNSSKLSARACESGAALLIVTALLLLSGSTKSGPLSGAIWVLDVIIDLYRSGEAVGKSYFRRKRFC